MPTANPTHESLAAALVAAQAEFPAVEPDSVNPHFKSKFVSLDHLIAKTRPILNKHGLAISQWPSGHAENGTLTPTLTTRLTHVSGESMEAVMPLVLTKQDMQGLGAALTYARRYSWAAALGISADEDDDGNQASAPAAKPAAKPKPTSEPVVNGAVDRLGLLAAVEAGIARLAPENPNWTLDSVLGGAEKMWHLKVTSLDDLTTDHLAQILAAMPGEQTAIA